MMTTVSPALRTACRAAIALTPATRLLAVGAASIVDATDFAAVAHAAHIGGTGVAAIAADPLRLPFVAALFDTALVVDALGGPAPGGTLRELWRVLAPAGRVVLVVPCRWRLARLPGSPLRRGGFTRTTLGALLDAAMFTAVTWESCDGFIVVTAHKRDGLAPGLAARAAASPARRATSGGAARVSPASPSPIASGFRGRASHRHCGGAS